MTPNFLRPLDGKNQWWRGRIIITASVVLGSQVVMGNQITQRQSQVYPGGDAFEKLPEKPSEQAIVISMKEVPTLLRQNVGFEHIATEMSEAEEAAAARRKEERY